MTSLLLSLLLAIAGTLTLRVAWRRASIPVLGLAALLSIVGIAGGISSILLR